MCLNKYVHIFRVERRCLLLALRGAENDACLEFNSNRTIVTDVAWWGSVAWLYRSTPTLEVDKRSAYTITGDCWSGSTAQHCTCRLDFSLEEHTARHGTVRSANTSTLLAVYFLCQPYMPHTREMFSLHCTVLYCSSDCSMSFAKHTCRWLR